MLFKIGVLKNFHGKFHGKTPVLEPYFNKVARTSGGCFLLQCVFNIIPNQVLPQ